MSNTDSSHDIPLPCWHTLPLLDRAVKGKPDMRVALSAVNTASDSREPSNQANQCVADRLSLDYCPIGHATDTAAVLERKDLLDANYGRDPARDPTVQSGMGVVDRREQP
jgi:hypothetical protein